MIKNVSSAFKANCKKDSVKYREYIVIDNKEVDIKGNLTDTAYKDTTFFGKFNLKMLKFETENDIDYKKKEFTYYKEVDGEPLKIGTFIVTDVSDSDTFESVNVTAYDYGLKFANPYKSTLNYSDGNVTLFQVIQEICTNCDVELENTSLSNGSFIVDSNQFVNGEQYGDVVAQASGINGMFATINSNDKLEFIFTNETNEIIEDYVELDDKRDTWPITSVLVATSEDLETAGAVKKDQSLIEQYGEHWLKIYSYGFAYSTEKCQQLVNAIFNQVKGFAYSSFKSEYSFLPYLSLGDKIKFKNKEGKLVDSVILRYETNYDEITLEAPSIISASVEYTLPETNEQKIDKVGIEVNQALKTIELLSEKIVDISAQTSGHKEVKLENCSATPLYKLKITGDDSLLFPGDKKKHFTYETYEGSSIDVDIKGSSYDINSLDVKGRSTQEAIPSPDYPSEIKSVKGRNLFDENKAKISDNYVTNASIGTGWKTITIDLAPNTQYTITRYADNVAAYPTFNLQFYLYEDTSNPLFYVNNFQNEGTLTNRTKTFTTGNSGKIYLAGLYANNDRLATLFENINIQIEKGSTITKYVPYDTIQIINTGKNLFDKDSEDVGHVYSSTGSYSASVLWNTSDWISVESNSQYTLSWKTTDSVNMFFSEFDKDKTFIQRTTTSILTPTNNTKYVRLSYKNDLGTYDIQIEKGSVVTPFEEYKAQTIDVDLNGNELCSIGDTKDILDISVTGDTEINKKIGKVVLDGSENWRIGTAPNQTNTTYFSCDSYDNIISAKTNKIMSDYFLYNNDLWLRDVEGIYFDIVNSNLIRIRISKDIVTTVEEFKTWLSTHNVTVIYELATPETINLSPTKPLYLYDGINHLTNDNNADMVAKMVKSTMFLKTSDLYINQGQSNEKIFNLKIPALRELNGVKDEYNLENTKATLTKRIGLNANLEEYILTKPQIIDLGEMTIELDEGTNILTMPSFPNNYYEVTYLLKNEYTDTFANQAQVSSMINIASDEILIKSKTEILENGDELIASINTQSTGNVLINASRLAQINANKINFNSYDFNVTTQNMKISIGQGDNKKDIINSNGVLTNLIYNGYTRGNMITGTGDYIPLGRVGGGDTKDTQRNEMIFSFKLPQNFTIQSAKIYLSHAPINWNISGTSITGYSRNLELYKGQNIEKLKINYDVVNSIINTGGVTTDKIYDVLGTNGFSGNATTTVSTKSAELKDYIDVDKDNYFIIKDSNETAYTTNNDIFGRTGGVFGYLEIIGYSQV